jgi:hypothetical protein
MKTFRNVLASAFAIALMGSAILSPTPPAQADEPTPQDHVDNCTEGTWNFRQVIGSSACAYGNITRAGSGSSRRIVVNVTVHDFFCCEQASLRYEWINSSGGVEITTNVGHVTHGVRPVQEDRFFNGYARIRVKVCHISNNSCSGGVNYAR